MLLELNRWVIPPGHQALIENISWSELEQILEELGEARSRRISYSDGILEIMTPLAEHEDDKALISDFVRIILEELGQEYRNLGSITLKREDMGQAVEPDECFYIQNEASVRGKKRIDLNTMPPPDLVIEIDITNRTRFNHYERLGVLELWRYDGSSLEINILQSGKYILSKQSLQFPQFLVEQAIPQYIEASKVDGKVAMMKQFRGWIREQIAA
ncbi:MAG: Uma2 family endonuclease [Cyanobacteria bacterium]|jgi:Uma2 family endonuclease|nr:Uma2 family endonuclease [Cyanobacteria bacterium GSL.Bin21]